MPTQKISDTKMPKDGWVQELGDAESAAKKSRSAGAQLRLAIAAYKLREFKKVKTAANLGLALDPSEGEKELLKEYVEKSKEQKEMTIDNNILKQIQDPGVKMDVFYFYWDGVPYTNLNALHYAAVTGDVSLMEEVVAHGAAVDLPVTDKNASGVPPLPAPPGSTALLLACAMLAMLGKQQRIDSNDRRVMATEVIGHFDLICECAIQLVYLGANCQVKLQIPAQRRNTPVNPNDLVAGFRALNFGGKTAQELASISCRRELIHAIELMQKPESVHLTQCRCGSRLPFNQCHGAPVPGQSNPYLRADDDGRLYWRVSPKARCPCKLTNDEHYKCCWFTNTPFYMNDTSGDLAKAVVYDSNMATSQVNRRLQYTRISDLRFSDITTEELRTIQIELFRFEGLSFLDDFNGRRCGVKDWDPTVYAGVVDRIDDCFTWNDLHWRLSKAELLQRTKEWNEALEKYCDDKGLTGAERKAVMQKHTANPCAPCANLPCNKWETKPKEFQSCSHCIAVAYCSRDCQKKDWKAQHKSACGETYKI
jgi:hypothetical protein